MMSILLDIDFMHGDIHGQSCKNVVIWQNWLSDKIGISLRFCFPGLLHIASQNSLSDKNVTLLGP